jgi:hypothetical protein
MADAADKDDGSTLTSSSSAMTLRSRAEEAGDIDDDPSHSHGAGNQPTTTPQKVLDALTRRFTKPHNNWRVGSGHAWQGVVIEKGRLVYLDAGALPLAKPLKVKGLLTPLWTESLRVVKLGGPLIVGRLDAICGGEGGHSGSGCRNLRTVSLTHTNLKGDLRCLGELAALVRLNLTGSRKLGGSVDALKHCRELEVVILSNSRNVSGNVSAFAEATKLTVVELDTTAVFGHVESFRACKRLHTLKCKYTQVLGDAHSIRWAAPLCNPRDILAVDQRLGVS